MSTRNDRFNKLMCSLEEFIDTFEDPSKIAAFSDGATGVPPVGDEGDREASSNPGATEAMAPCAACQRARCPLPQVFGPGLGVSVY